MFKRCTLEVGLLAMYLYTPEPAGECIRSAAALTHGGWVIYDGDMLSIRGAHPLKEVNSRKDAVDYFKTEFKAIVEGE
jgi:hypothetical protein